MSKITVCDLCDAHHPEYTFQYRAKRTWYMGLDTYTTYSQICDECWKDLRKKAEKKRKKH
jgi:hypothetical protein